MNPDKLNTTATKTPPALEQDDDREPTKEELLADLRIALRDAIAGEEGIPAREGLEAIRRRIYGDADHS
ncbi:MAG: hypothetical protein OXE52_13310 [Chloroflexi bacterium]|nr:hypothetical protein [Chloroflexota bacterium]